MYHSLEGSCPPAPIVYDIVYRSRERLEALDTRPGAQDGGAHVDTGSRDDPLKQHLRAPGAPVCLPVNLFGRGGGFFRNANEGFWLRDCSFCGEASRVSTASCAEVFLSYYIYFCYISSVGRGGGSCDGGSGVCFVVAAVRGSIRGKNRFPTQKKRNFVFTPERNSEDYGVKVTH